MSACLQSMPGFRPTIKQIMDVDQIKVAKQRRWAEVWSKEDMAGTVADEDVETDSAGSDMSLTPTPANPHPDRNPPSWNGATGLLGAGAQVTTPTMTPASLLHTPRKPSAATVTPPSFASPTPISSTVFGNSPGNPFAAPSAPPPQTPSRGPGAPTTHRGTKRTYSRTSSFSSSGSTPGPRPAAHLKPHLLSYDPNELATASFGVNQPRNAVGRSTYEQHASSSQPLPGSTPVPFASSSQPLPESTPVAAGDGYMWPHLAQQPLSGSQSFSEGFTESSPTEFNTNGALQAISTSSLTPSSTSSSPLTDYDSPLAARVSAKPRPSSMQPPSRISFLRTRSTPAPAPATSLGLPTLIHFTPTPSASQPSYIPGPEPQDTPMTDANLSEDDGGGHRTFVDQDADLSSQGGVTSYGGDDDEYDDDEDTPAHMQSPLRGVRSRTFSHPATFRPVHFAGFRGGDTHHQHELDPRTDQVSQGPSPPLTAPDDGLVRDDDEDSVMEDAPGSDPGTCEYARQAAAAADQRRRASLSAFHSPRR
ncbi:hypothetical protein BCR44DRAFT_1497049 [Catenaria anguillulae PL171]|uniref:Uncharacterized protein n=1 Tax=Catenaria anguillulae PL171 TaxID=765915 RepID=A0A1Y2HZ43_9FUNG|nr:hypothetical protein BCR44DRAFT_1497049 [Catenaria anguillulae PL171]